MKFLLDNWFLVALALASGAMLFIPGLRGRAAAAGISPSAAVTLINREKAQIVDICDKAEYDAGHLPNAKHIPLGKLGERIKELEKFKDKPILVNCQAGVRSLKACDILRKHEFTKLHNLQGGLNAWIAAKLPVVKG